MEEVEYTPTGIPVMDKEKRDLAVAAAEWLASTMLLMPEMLKMPVVMMKDDEGRLHYFLTEHKIDKPSMTNDQKFDFMRMESSHYYNPMDIKLGRRVIVAEFTHTGVHKIT